MENILLKQAALGINHKKSAADIAAIELLTKNCTITIDSICYLMNNCRNKMQEMEVE